MEDPRPEGRISSRFRKSASWDPPLMQASHFDEPRHVSQHQKEDLEETTKRAGYVASSPHPSSCAPCLSWPGQWQWQVPYTKAKKPGFPDGVIFTKKNPPFPVVN